MRGIYIHIPFCRQACRYCDFFFTVSLRHRDEYITSLIKEIGLRSPASGMPEKVSQTLYLGGGTPSVFPAGQLKQVMESLFRHFSFSADAEITIECNPDDLDREYLFLLRKLGFNRLSIGIQSFMEEELRLMRRSHTAEQAARCVRDAAEAGFSRISADLIYGIPGQDLSGWENNLRQVLSLPIDHLSAYHLTYEPGTVFNHWVEKKKLAPMNEQDSIRSYRLLREYMRDAGFDHYEISNFAGKGSYSRQNLVYWKGHSYMGFGPSAHSFGGTRRSWNISSLKRYTDALDRGSLPASIEELTPSEEYHDALVTSLRTKWGTNRAELRQRFGSRVRDHFDRKAKPYLDQGILRAEGTRVMVDPAHWLITDHILRDLFLDGTVI